MYGYDQFSVDDITYDDYYSDNALNTNSKESFSNNVNQLLYNEDYEDNMKYKLFNSINTNKKLNNVCGRYKEILHYKSKELQDLQSHTYMLYILIIIAVLVIVNQKMSINSLYQLIYILKLNTTNPELRSL